MTSVQWTYDCSQGYDLDFELFVSGGMGIGSGDKTVRLISSNDDDHPVP